MAKNTKQERSMALYEAVLAIKDLDECCRFFDDLCTPTELRSMEQRYDVAAALMQEQVYREIQESPGPAAPPSAVCAAISWKTPRAARCGKLSRGWEKSRKKAEMQVQSSKFQVLSL